MFKSYLATIWRHVTKKPSYLSFDRPLASLSFFMIFCVSRIRHFLMQVLTSFAAWNYIRRELRISKLFKEKKKEKILHTSFFSSFSRRASSSSRHKCSLLLSRLSLSLSCSSCHLLLRKKDLFCLKHQDRLTWRDNSTILSSSLSPICFRLLLVFIEGSLIC